MTAKEGLSPEASSIFRYVLLACAMSFANRGMPTPFLPLVVQDSFGQPASMVGFVMAAYPVAAFVATPVVGSLSRKTENITRLHACSLVAMAIACASFISCDLVGHALGGFAALLSIIAFRALQGFANALFLAAHNSLVARTFKLKELPYVVAMLEVAMAGGSQVGRLAGGILFQFGGFAFPFLFTSLTLVLMALFGFSLGERKGEVELVAPSQWEALAGERISEAGKQAYHEYNAKEPRWKTNLRDPTVEVQGKAKRTQTTSLSRGVHTVSWKNAWSDYKALERLEDVEEVGPREDSIRSAGSAASNQAEQADVPWLSLLRPRVVLAGVSVFCSMLLMGFYDAALPKHLMTHLGPISMSTLSLLISVRTLTYMTTAYVSAQILHKHLVSLEGLIAVGAVSCTIGLTLVAPQPFVAEGEAFIAGQDLPATALVWTTQIASLAFSAMGQALTLMPTLPLMQAEVRKLGTRAGEQVSTIFISLMTLGEAVGPILGGTLVQLFGFTASTIIIACIFPPVFAYTVAVYDQSEIDARKGDGEHLQHAGDFSEQALEAYSKYSQALPRWSKNLRKFKRSASTSLSRGRHTVMWHSTFSPYYCMG